MLSERDKAAVFALLVRQVEAQEARASAQKVIEEKKEVIAAANLQLNNLRTAFSVFGFQMTGERPWDEVKDSIGSRLFHEAIAVGKGETPVDSPNHSTDEQEDDQEQDYESYEDTDQSNYSPPPNIREMVIERLKQAGNSGAKVADVKKFIAGQGIEMHDKTAGMTLYRLSKEGIARREGRTWFYLQPASDIFGAPVNGSTESNEGPDASAKEPS